MRLSPYPARDSLPRLRQPRADSYRLSSEWETRNSERNGKPTSRRTGPKRRKRKATGSYEIGEQHRAWPEWTWDGSARSRHAEAAARRARIETMTPTIIAVPIAETVRIRRLTEFAADVTRLADQRPDLDLRALIDDLYRDLTHLEEER